MTLKLLCHCNSAGYTCQILGQCKNKTTYSFGRWSTLFLALNLNCICQLNIQDFEINFVSLEQFTQHSVICLSQLE
jgi:hypothetical protein